jgi:uncharacterized protein (DUF2384 family)
LQSAAQPAKSDPPQGFAVPQEIVQAAKSRRDLEAFAQRVLGSQTECWLQSPVPALNHRTPSDLLDESAGREQVAQVLFSLYRGDF